MTEELTPTEIKARELVSAAENMGAHSLATDGLAPETRETLLRLLTAQDGFVNNADDLRDYAEQWPGQYDVSAPMLWEELANINEGIAQILAQGTESRRAETTGSVHDGPVPEGNAPKGDDQ